MYRSVKSDKDAYITDRVIRGTSQTGANTGQAGTMDIFKIYGLNVTQSVSGTVSLNELSRGLIHFDLTALSSDYAAGAFDITSPTFQCLLTLHDVAGGQPTPTNFTLKVYPVSQSWTEGRGKDIVYYQDSDVVNFLTATYSTSTQTPTLWFASGANAAGFLGSSNIDVIASGNLGAGSVNLWTTQSFLAGTEDMSVDVTQIVSATLKGLLPDYGYRISFDEATEGDQRSHFVKRFGTRQAIDPSVRPELIVKYNDSEISHQSSFYFDSLGTLFAKNYLRGTPANFVSGSTLTQITGSNCMLVKVWTYYSTSTGYQQYAQYATASQRTVGSVATVGVYSATFSILSNDSRLSQLISNAALTGSNTPVAFNEVWTSLDGTVAFLSATLYVRPQDATVGASRPRRYEVNVPNVATAYASDEVVRFTASVFDRSTPFFRYVRVPQDEPSQVLEAYYSVRDAVADTTVVPFDNVKGSTRMSADGESLYFDVWMDALVPGRTYVLDVMVVDGGKQEIFYDASPAFKVQA